MNKPSERIVVFVTTAQKRAIAATAANLGISVSELMRRAVLSFGATSEQVKAASIVDRLRAPRAPDALDAALQRVARGTRHARAALPAALQTPGGGETGVATEGAATADAAATPDVANAAGTPSNAHAVPRKPAAVEPAPLLPAGVAAALAAEIDEETVATTEAVARVAAAKAAATEGASPPQSDTEAQLRSVLKRPRVDSSRDDDDPRTDPSTEGGRFA
jgi:murein DD-endopeptidase MepM/ murein hydrolase activator NlpD